MEIEISGCSSPISCEVFDIDDNYARDYCESHHKLEFKDDDNFFNTDVPIEEESEQDVLHHSLDATSDINLFHSQIPNEAIPKLDMKFKTEQAAYEFYNAYAYKVVCTPSKTHLHKSHRKLCVAQVAELDMANDCGIAPKATVEFMARQAGGRENLRLVDDRRYKELKANFRATQSTPSLSFPVEMLKHAASMYTPDVFVLFQRELSKAHECNLKNFDMVLCSCKKFEFVGLLCSHALKVLYHNNVMRILKKYILKRWTKNAKSGSTATCAWTSLIEDPQAMMGKRYKELCRLCTQLATRAAETEEAYNIALNCLKKIAEEVDASLSEESFDGTSNANNSASLKNEATLGEGIRKELKG
ncbi:hypothetical protein RHSIM_Rhsim10G0077500 [Rhododendron simsii]|uniref:Protein FAR1-RELATED SEQUENCE n=1 Tax=Rhododendron simsii TaxID=118357 RepID=A0A834LBT9_RHOSS|nr:hypothetical protein RHSIM_Rhsim10G0077500 [Rhododendron simsii]